MSTLFKGENDLAFVVLGVLQEANLIKIHNEDIEITNPFDLKNYVILLILKKTFLIVGCLKTPYIFMKILIQENS